MATTAPRPSAGLPTELTSFIGRERELQELAGLMARSRLVTLTGAAGSGKTRLALQLVGRAGELAGLPGPVRWVELASLRDAGLVVPAVAEAMGLREEVRGGDLAALVRLLHTHRALLVLDNCEHLVDDVAALVDGLLRQCPDLAILATSREALGVPGERAWLVPPLSVPRRDDPGDPTAAEAVRLFVERAADVVPGFALTPDNQDAVVEICRRLDGIPLAIELAAARIRVLSAADIRDRLDDVFRLLSTGGRTAVPRHRTLRAAIDWSHDLLTEESRALLRRLAVFRGGFGLEGAEAVGPGPGLQAVEVLDVLARLVDRSLVGVREHHGAARYSLLEAVRQYALEQLVASGEEEETRRRHARHVLQRVEEAEPHFIRRERKLWVDRLQPDLDNIRSALGWSREHDPALHVRLVGKLWWFWFSTQHWTEGGRWVDGALRLARDAAPDADDDAAADDAADASPATSSERDRAAILFAAGALAALQVRTEEAQGALREAADLAARLGDGRLEAYALNYLGMTYAGEGRAEAMELCRRAETWFREHDDLYGLRLALLLQGSLAAARGAMDDAVRFNEEGVGVARRFGLDRELAVALQNLAAVHLTREQLEPAESLIREAMAASRRDPSYYFIATGLAYLGELECRRGRVELGARLLGAAEATRERVGAVAFRIDRARLEGQLPAFRAAIGDDAFDRAWAEGRAVRPETLMEEILGAAPAVTARVDTVPAAAAPAASGRTLAASNGGGAAVDRPRPSEPEPLLRVDALGPLVVHVDGHLLEPERWTYAKPRELLLFLLLNPHGSTRDQVGEALWPGAPRSNVKNSFHVTLHHLRKTLGHPEWVVTEGDRYRLEPALPYALDVDRFEAAAAGILARARMADPANGEDPAAGPDPAAIRETLALCRGEILEGDVVGRWIDDHRDRVRRRVVELTLALGGALEREDPGAAAEMYRALAAREELDEEVHRRLMASWARAGDRVQALRHYERVVELLREALDAEPEPGTVALYESIRAGVPV